MGLLQQLSSWIETPQPEISSAEEPDSIREIAALQKRIRIVPPPAEERRRFPDLERVQQSFQPFMDEYLAEPEPNYILLFLASPGTGKTTAAVHFADKCVNNGSVQRVLYAGPRRNFYADVSDITLTENWYKWLPRQVGETDEEMTCIHAENIGKWLSRGYDAIDFCSQVCGWKYYNKECVYMQQKKRPERIIYGNHQHLTMGHPLEFDLVIGDEDPKEAFTNQWVIPESSIVPEKMQFSAYKELLCRLAGLCRAAKWTTGEALIKDLGGADHVLSVTKDFDINPDILTPHIKYSDEVDGIPFNHIYDTAKMLHREARQAKFMNNYIPRIAIGNSSMTLFLRRSVDWERMPKHMIWLDATANPKIYTELFGKAVMVVDARAKMRGRIFQVHDRLNGKSSMINENGSSEKAKQSFLVVKSIVASRGYRNPAVITFDKIQAEIEDVKTGHFYAARGTNNYEECDSIFILGTPQPAAPDIVSTASMIYFRRDRAFRTIWMAAGIPELDDEAGMEEWKKTRRGQFNYVGGDGMGRAYPVSGFWQDSDLQEVLWSMREAEIIQAAHRVRPVRKEVDIWLLTNLPIWELPPTRIMTMGEAIGAPEGVNIFRWGEIMRTVGEIEEENGLITAEDLIERCKLDQKTAKKYMNILIKTGEWKFVYAISRKPGRQPMRIRRLETG